jgi:energy-coupling factor transporter transmembrane protein EcfT
MTLRWSSSYNRENNTATTGNYYYYYCCCCCCYYCYCMIIIVVITDTVVLLVFLFLFLLFLILILIFILWLLFPIYFSLFLYFFVFFYFVYMRRGEETLRKKGRNKICEINASMKNQCNLRGQKGWGVFETPLASSIKICALSRKQHGGFDLPSEIEKVLVFCRFVDCVVKRVFQTSITART